MAKQKKPRSKPARSTEPTVSQQRQAYYEARARKQSLDELGVLAPGEEPVRPAPDRKAALEALDSFDRLMILYGICRWTAVSGRPPEPEDWADDKDWPQPDAVDALFGSWDDALTESGVLDSAVEGLLDRVAKAHQEMARRTEELERTQRRLEEEAQRIPELERQMERHKARRDESDLRLVELQGERERLIADRDRADARAGDVERRVAELEAAAAAHAPAGPDGAEIEPLRRELAAAREEILRLHDELDGARADAERDRTTIARLSALVGRPEEPEPAAGATDEAEEDEPASVLEAVERVAATAAHLRFAPRAFETAEDSPFRRPGLVLRTLRQLDELAARYAEGDMGVSLAQAARDVGITQWKAGVSELARTRWRDEYLVTIDGQEVLLGPHVALGSGSGAGFVARIYLHVADGGDGLPRGITVGVVGRHLPDTTT